MIIKKLNLSNHKWNVIKMRFNSFDLINLSFTYNYFHNSWRNFLTVHLYLFKAHIYSSGFTVNLIRQTLFLEHLECSTISFIYKNHGINQINLKYQSSKCCWLEPIVSIPNSLSYPLQVVLFSFKSTGDNDIIISIIIVALCKLKSTNIKQTSLIFRCTID